MNVIRHAILLLALVIVAPLTPAQAATAEVDQPAPDFELTLVDGSKVTLGELRGQVIVLNYWATWCGPCKKELPLLDTYYRIQQQHGLRVFAIATEDSVPERKLKPLFAKLAIQSVRRIKGPYPILKGVPTNYVIDRSGKVRYAKAGAFDLDDVNNLLVPLLQEPAPTVTAAR